MWRRHISTILILILALYAPFWLTAAALFSAMIFFPLYAEGVGIAFLLDSLYGFPASHGFFSHSVFLFVSALIIFCAVALVRRQIRHSFHEPFF